MLAEVRPRSCPHVLHLPAWWCRGASKEQLAQIVESAKAHVAATLREGKSPTPTAEKSKDRER